MAKSTLNLYNLGKKSQKHCNNTIFSKKKHAISRIIVHVNAEKSLIYFYK